MKIKFCFVILFFFIFSSMLLARNNNNKKSSGELGTYYLAVDRYTSTASVTTQSYASDVHATINVSLSISKNNLDGINDLDNSSESREKNGIDFNSDLMEPNDPTCTVIINLYDDGNNLVDSRSFDVTTAQTISTSYQVCGFGVGGNCRIEYVLSNPQWGTWSDANFANNQITIDIDSCKD